MHQMAAVMLDSTLRPDQLVRVAADDRPLMLTAGARARIAHGHALLRALIDRGTRAYGVNTGVGALADTVVVPELAAQLSRNIVMSHAVGVGPPLGRAETRAIMAASVAMYAHGVSGVRPQVVDMLVALLNAGCTPVVPRQGSVGYISHRAHIAVALIGYGQIVCAGETLPATAVLERLGLSPLVLEAKEGLSLINGTACATGLAALALCRMAALLDWADVIAAMTFEVLGGQRPAISSDVMSLRISAGGRRVAETMTRMLHASPLLDAAQGLHTQDALSLRATPQIHGAARDAWAHGAGVIADELASATDNPALTGTVECPVVWSQAHAVAAGIGLAADYLATVTAQLTMLSERRIDRMVNPLVSGLPAFLAVNGGVASGFMIAHYTATALVAENRRLATPASLDGGRNSALQEDMLCHATPAALKLLDIVANARMVLAIELLAVCQAHDLRGGGAGPATQAIIDAVRERVGRYGDDRPLAGDMAAIDAFLGDRTPDDVGAGAVIVAS